MPRDGSRARMREIQQFHPWRRISDIGHEIRLPLCVLCIKLHWLHLDFNYLQIYQISTKHHLLPAGVIRLPEEDFNTIGRYPSPPCHHAMMLLARLFFASQPSACRVSSVQPNLRYSKHHISGKCVKGKDGSLDDLVFVPFIQFTMILRHWQRFCRPIPR